MATSLTVPISRSSPPYTHVLDDSHSRSSSINSYTPSTTPSTRPMLPKNDSSYLPPIPPYASSPSLRSLSLPQKKDGDADSSSIIRNYVPQKFSQLTNRKMKMPRGGGRDAFKANESRMPGDGDDDYDGVNVGQSGRKGRLRWNRFKWVLFVANLIFSIYSLTGLIACLLIHFDVWVNADIIRVGNKPELIVSTIAATVAVLTSLIGWSGILLNNRAFLAVYSFMLWVCFALLVTPGYITYKKRTFNLEGKVNAQWSRDLGLDGRLRIQNQLHCCGYFNPFIEATVSQTCYARSLLSGCKGPYIKFERTVLERWYTVVFSLVLPQLGIMIIALLCSNHVTYRFGKGMMPKAYRLDPKAVAAIMDEYASRWAEQYGPNLQYGSNLMPDMDSVPYQGGAQYSRANK